MRPTVRERGLRSPDVQDVVNDASAGAVRGIGLGDEAVTVPRARLTVPPRKGPANRSFQGSVEGSYQGLLSGLRRRCDGAPRAGAGQQQLHQSGRLEQTLLAFLQFAIHTPGQRGVRRRQCAATLIVPHVREVRDTHTPAERLGERLTHLRRRRERDYHVRLAHVSRLRTAVAAVCTGSDHLSFLLASTVSPVRGDVWKIDNAAQVRGGYISLGTRGQARAL
jgi:hypothetical protein